MPGLECNSDSKNSFRNCSLLASLYLKPPVLLEIPDVWVNNWWIVISLLSIGVWIKYELILSDVFIFPCSTSIKIADAVNCLVTEPILKTV